MFTQGFFLSHAACLQNIHSGQQAIIAFSPAGNLFLLAKGQNIPPRQS
jgi:hypothetical protein